MRPGDKIVTIKITKNYKIIFISLKPYKFTKQFTLNYILHHSCLRRGGNKSHKIVYNQLPFR